MLWHKQLATIWDGTASLHCTAASFETSASRGSLPFSLHQQCPLAGTVLSHFCRPCQLWDFLADLWMQGTALAIWGEGGLRRPSILQCGPSESVHCRPVSEGDVKFRPGLTDTGLWPPAQATGCMPRVSHVRTKLQQQEEQEVEPLDGRHCSWTPPFKPAPFPALSCLNQLISSCTLKTYLASQWVSQHSHSWGRDSRQT